MIVGITGTVNGATSVQESTAHDLLHSFSFDTIIHGDAIGFDAQMHAVALEKREMDGSFGKPRIEVYPADFDDKRAFCEGADVIHDPMPPLQRNRLIAARCDLLIAGPMTAEEYLRSGTWATVRYARQLKKLIIRINPDGTTEFG